MTAYQVVRRSDGEVVAIYDFISLAILDIESRLDEPTMYEVKVVEKE